MLRNILFMQHNKRHGECGEVEITLRWESSQIESPIVKVLSSSLYQRTSKLPPTMTHHVREIIPFASCVWKLNNKLGIWTRKQFVYFTPPQHLRTCNRSSEKCAHERVYHKHGDTQSNEHNIQRKHLLAEPQPNRVHPSYSKSRYQKTMQPQPCTLWQQAFQASQYQ